VNIVLARTQPKEDYGMFALAYSVFTFFSGLHNAAVLEPCTVYGSGRYRNRFSQYLRLMIRINATFVLLLTAFAFFALLLLNRLAPLVSSRALWGMAATAGVLLSGTLLRRIFYLQRQPALAAQGSLICFASIACTLWLANESGRLNDLSAFIVLATGWAISIVVLRKRIAVDDRDASFLSAAPEYWREHWKYSRWVFATAIVFQLATQGYYWVVAGILAVKEVGELRAMYLLIAPMEQVFIALSLLVIPALSEAHSAKNSLKFFSLWRRLAFGVVALTALFALLVRLFGREIMHILYAGKFDGLASTLYVLGGLPLVLGVGSIASCALNSAERPKLVFSAYAASGTATFLFGIPLVSHLGVRGAAYGMLLSAATCTATLLLGFLSVFYSRRVSRLSLPPIFHPAVVKDRSYEQ
jgi:O-antigen/teichoic acid export membrane protein